MRYATTIRTSVWLEGWYIPHKPILINDSNTACRSNGHDISCDCSLCRELDGAHVTGGGGSTWRIVRTDLTRERE